MKFEFIIMAFQALLANKTRTALSMLGVIIGVSTVILVTGIGTAAENMIGDQFKNLSVDSILVVEDGGSSKLSPDDIEKVVQSPYIKKGIAALRGGSNMSYSGFSGNYAVFGLGDGFFEFSNLKVGTGQGFTPEDLSSRPKKVILGYNLSEDILEEYPNTDLIGDFIKINKKQFEIIGILEENGNSGPAISYDNSIFLPYDTADKNVLGVNGEMFITFIVEDIEKSEEAKEDMTQILREAHNLKEWNEDDFRFFDAGSLVSVFTGAAKVFTYLLLSIASIILVVSGIGIMNVMFVVVAERTKEIGILKAVGAKQSSILAQFLLESVQLSLVAGSIGIAIGTGIIWGINTVVRIIGENILAQTGTNPVMGLFLPISVDWIIISFCFSVAVGIFFGFVPALQASRLDPVDALRSE